MKTTINVLAILVIYAISSSASFGQSRLFYGVGGSIFSVDLEGMDERLELIGSENPGSLIVADDGRLYWVDISGTIQWIDGTDLATYSTRIMDFNDAPSRVIGVDNQEYVYWGSGGYPALFNLNRSSLDGLSHVSIVPFSLDVLYSITFDPDNDAIYFRQNNSLIRIDLDGQNRTELASNFGHEFVISPLTQRVYYSVDLTVVELDLATGSTTIVSSEQADLLRISPDGSLLIARNDTELRYIDLVTGTENRFATATQSPSGFPGDVHIDFDAGWAYWSHRGGSISRFKIDGSATEEIVPSFIGYQLGIWAIDPEGDAIYWVEEADFGKPIWTSDLSGNNPRRMPGFLPKDFPPPSHLAVDLENQRLFIAQSSHGLSNWNLNDYSLSQIWSTGTVSNVFFELGSSDVFFSTLSPFGIVRATTDGSGSERLIEDTGYLRPETPLTIDVARGQIYWSNVEMVNGSAKFRLHTSDLSGGNRDILVESDTSYTSLAGDFVEGALFMVSSDSGHIVRFDLASLEFSDVALSPGDVWSLQVDPVSKQLFWISQDDELIRKSDYQGNMANIRFLSGPIGGILAIGLDGVSTTIDENELPANTGLLTIYPNPSTDRIKIVGFQADQGGTFTVIDALGRVVMRKDVSNNSTESLDISSWAPGAYHVTFSSRAGNQTARFVRVP